MDIDIFGLVDQNNSIYTPIHRIAIFFERYKMLKWLQNCRYEPHNIQV